MRTKRAVASLHLVALLVVSGCGGDEETPAATTQAPTTTSTTIGVDEVPEEITLEYVQRVMDAIDRSTGEMFRRFREQGEVTDETRAWVRELHAEELVEQSYEYMKEKYPGS